MLDGEVSPYPSDSVSRWLRPCGPYKKYEKAEGARMKKESRDLLICEINLECLLDLDEQEK